MAKGGNGATIVLKKVEEGGHGHHGGAWKVAYADFVTAMMAFFLLMWLLNATTEEQRAGIADYFAPTNVMGRTSTGSGEPFGGRTPHASEQMTQDTGAVRVERGPLPVLPDVETEDDSAVVARPVPMRAGPEGEDEENDPRRVRTARADAAPGDQDPRERLAEGTGEATDPRTLSDAELRAEHERRERAAFERAAEEIRRVVESDPALADLGRQLLIEQAPEGLRIQLLDAERQPMFALGGAAPNERARALIARVAQVAARLNNAIAITGHTDATPFRGGGERSNWDLSAERANATRRLLTEAGVPDARIQSVAGQAERQPLLPDRPNDAANRRVAITLLRGAPEGREAAAAVVPRQQAEAPRRRETATP
ncbi:flagellar motor protein MotB [Roseomonas sp. AR75]|uniref:flagellar motor protein MotB n=1 Tax=Roseomonas sp. AR75 TaxID=2562311 RepID=UPI0010C0748C|nr:flagellar motor protein MotB [Roseomonas sp. AR75]